MPQHQSQAGQRGGQPQKQPRSASARSLDRDRNCRDDKKEPTQLDAVPWNVHQAMRHDREDGTCRGPTQQPSLPRKSLPTPAAEPSNEEREADSERNPRLGGGQQPVAFGVRHRCVAGGSLDVLREDGRELADACAGQRVVGNHRQSIPENCSPKIHRATLFTRRAERALGQFPEPVATPPAADGKQPAGHHADSNDSHHSPASMDAVPAPEPAAPDNQPKSENDHAGAGNGEKKNPGERSGRPNGREEGREPVLTHRFAIHQSHGNDRPGGEETRRVVAVRQETEVPRHRKREGKERGPARLPRSNG